MRVNLIRRLRLHRHRRQTAERNLSFRVRAVHASRGVKLPRQTETQPVSGTRKAAVRLSNLWSFSITLLSELCITSRKQHMFLSLIRVLCSSSFSIAKILTLSDLGRCFHFLLQCSIISLYDGLELPIFKVSLMFSLQIRIWWKIALFLWFLFSF